MIAYPDASFLESAGFGSGFGIGGEARALDALEVEALAEE